MSLSVYEYDVFRNFAKNYIAEFKYAIENKKVNRYTEFKKTFSATVNASGSLANSAEYKIDGNELTIYVNYYIYWLIFGRKPQTSAASTPPKTEIQKWLAEKGGTGGSVYQVANAINKNGSSIWQFYKGQPSNLLEDIPLDKLFNDMQKDLGDRWIEKFTTDVVKVLDFEI